MGHFDPDAYALMMADEAPAYAALPGAVVGATMVVAPAGRILELGTATGVTTRGILTAHRGCSSHRSIDDQLRWLADAGREPSVAWRGRDLAVLGADPARLTRAP